MARVVGEVRPRFVFVENSPMLTSRGGTRVIADLTALGYACECAVMGAADVGAPHQRNRIWIVAHSTSTRREKGGLQDKGSDRCSLESRSSVGTGEPSCSSSSVAHSDGTYVEGNERSRRSTKKRTFSVQSSWWDIEPDVGRVANGVAARVDRLKAIGNGQVPAVAATAWRLLA